MVYKEHFTCRPIQLVDINRFIKYNGQKESGVLFIFRYGSEIKKKNNAHNIITSDFKYFIVNIFQKPLKKEIFECLL